MAQIKDIFLAKKKIVLAASVGNFLEMYAFSLYALLLPVLSPLFFSETNPLTSLLSSYLVLAVGFLAYPLGALIFGHIGDTVGRRASLSLSLLGMAIVTSLIGVLPTYSTIGIISPLLLACLRILQGICAGGECMGAGVLVIEHVLKKNSGFFGSLTAASGTFGALFASFLSTFLASSMFPSWAWRILFIISILIGFVGIYLRNSLQEPDNFETPSSMKGVTPIKEIFKYHLISFLCSIGVGALGTVPFYLIIGFLNSYLVTTGDLSLSNSIHLNFFLIFFCASTLPLAGYIADKFGIFKIMELSAIFSLLCAYPFFHLICLGSLPFIIIAEIIFLTFSQFFVAPLSAFVNRLFPTHLRFSGSSLGYCVGMALFGGTAPYIALSLITWSGNKCFPSVYLAFVCFLGFGAIRVGKRSVKNLENFERASQQNF